MKIINGVLLVSALVSLSISAANPPVVDANPSSNAHPQMVFADPAMQKALADAAALAVARQWPNGSALQSGAAGISLTVNTGEKKDDKKDKTLSQKFFDGSVDVLVGVGKNTGIIIGESAKLTLPYVISGYLGYKYIMFLAYKLGTTFPILVGAGGSIAEFLTFMVMPS